MSEWSSRMPVVVDSHVHMGGPEQEEIMLGLARETGIDRMGLVSIQDPRAGSGLAGSLYLKARHPARCYVFAGLNHAGKLYGQPGPALADQAEHLQQMGCDGIKMIEGKPTSRQRMNVPVTDAYFADYWAQVEDLGLPIVWHVNDPEEFWDPERIPGWAKERNWGYGPQDVQKEELYAEVDEVLARHPRLKIIFAHFYFLSADLPRAARFLDAHPSTHFDLAPGIEMLYHISRTPEAGREFFLRFADRIVFGTDLFSRLTPAEGRVRAGIVFRWLETSDTFRVPEEADFLLGPPEDGVIRGLALPEEVLDRIYRQNLERLAGTSPKPLDLGLAGEACARAAALAEALSGTPAPNTEAGQAAAWFAARG